MSDTPSRREILIGGIATSLSVPIIVNAQTNSAVSDAIKSPDNDLLVKAKKASADNSVERQKYALRENSEPCFTFIAEPREVRKR